MTRARLAVISDIHGDLPALEAALALAREKSCDMILCAGDLVDGDAFPDEVIARLASDRIPTIRGNHDRWAIAGNEQQEPGNGQRRRAVGNALGNGYELAPGSLRFLRALSTTWNKIIAGKRVVMWHARHESDMEGIFPGRTSPLGFAAHLSNADADVLIVGHTHIAFAAQMPTGRLVVNPGALYTDAMSFREREGGSFFARGPDTGGTMGILDLPAGDFRVYRVRDGIEIDLAPRLR